MRGVFLDYFEIEVHDLCMCLFSVATYPLKKLNLFYRALKLKYNFSRHGIRMLSNSLTYLQVRKWNMTDMLDGTLIFWSLSREKCRPMLVALGDSKIRRSVFSTAGCRCHSLYGLAVEFKWCVIHENCNYNLWYCFYLYQYLGKASTVLWPAKCHQQIPWQLQWHSWWWK